MTETDYFQPLKTVEKAKELLESLKTGKLKIGVSSPPDEIFKYRFNRVAPAQQVWKPEGSNMYIPAKAEYIPNKGNFVYYYGVPFPSKTVAPVEAIHAMSGPKRLTIDGLKFLSQIHKKGRINRLVEWFNNICWMSMHPFYLKDEYYCGTATQIRNFVRTLAESFGVKGSLVDPRGETVTYADRLGENMGYFFEYDNAYRTRIQDLATEANMEALFNDLPKELNRLIGLLCEREVNKESGIDTRFKAGVKVLDWAWKMPFIRKRIRKALKSMDLDKMKLDEADIYHYTLFGDYNTQGKNLEERVANLVKYHGMPIFGELWPPRMSVSNTNNGTGK